MGLLQVVATSIELASLAEYANIEIPSPDKKLGKSLRMRLAKLARYRASG